MIRLRDLFLDVDGVFADFDSAYFSIFGVRIGGDAQPISDDELWGNIRTVEGWFERLPVMPGALLMWDAFRKYDPTFLSGVDPAKYTNGHHEKRQWVNRHFGSDAPLIVCKSEEKCLHGRPGDILVDDRTKYQGHWEKMGGVFVRYTTPGETIAQVEALMR